MRNNTLIKLLAVLAMCFVLGAALVACDDSANKEEEPVKVVAGVAFDSEGNLVITYNDNTTQKVALPAEETCTHKSIAKHTLEEHTATANGVYLEVCNDCGYAWIKYEQRHNWVNEPHVEKPTCTTGGYTTESYCDVCGAASEKTDIKDPIDHVWDDGTFVSNGNVCEDGGTVTYKCTFGCGTTKDEIVDKAPDEGIDGRHTVDAWDFTTNAPTTTAAGEAVGTCTECGETVTYDLPAFLKADGKVNSDVYTYVADERTSCRQDITGKFTLIANPDIAYEGVVVETADGSHMLYNKAGELVFVHAADVNKEYTYSTAEYAGIKGFADKDIDSCTPILAYYDCEAEYCDATVDVWAYSEHNWQLIGTDTIECEKEAFYHFECPDCHETKKDAIEDTPREHKYVYTGLYNLSGDDCDEFTYVIACEYDNCHIREEKTVKEGDAGLTIDRETLPVTCENDGKVYVSYVVNEETTLNYVHNIPKKGHVLNGQQMVAVLDNTADAPSVADTIYNWYEGCGIFAFDGKDITADEPVIAYFICEHADDEGVTHRVDVWAQKDYAAGETVGNGAPAATPAVISTEDEE